MLHYIENRMLFFRRHISLDIEIINIKSLQEEMQVLCNEWDSSLLTEASLVAQAMEIPAHFQKEEKRKRKRKHMPDEGNTENTTEESAEISFRNNVFFVSMDSVIHD